MFQSRENFQGAGQASSAGSGESLGLSWCEAGWNTYKELQAQGSAWKVFHFPRTRKERLPRGFLLLGFPIEKTGQTGKKSEKQTGTGKGALRLSPHLRGHGASQWLWGRWGVEKRYQVTRKGAAEQTNIPHPTAPSPTHYAGPITTWYIQVQGV